MNKFTIKDLENLSGIKAHTIRIWEQRYSFLKPQRTATNIRYYSNLELKMLLNISLLNKYGFKISHINRMSNDELREKTLTLTSAEAQQERIVNELIQHMVDVELDGFEKVLDQYIQLRGVEKTITYIIFPFLERIGILWLTDHINPAQEHLITNIIRQKLIVGIDNAITPLSLKTKMLLFLPENEHHELGLLFLQYMLKSRGVKVIYLGANVPVKDLEYIVELKKPDFVYTHLTTVIKEFNFDKFINNLKIRLPHQQIIISGLMAQTFQKKPIPSNFRFLKSFSEVNEFLGSLT
ncbi:MerR family transcriptional regulator [Lacibacter sediminis]|uniref:MerR family transcriptional regulator n=1 Tax=Lacibacter sediminis TaxID=2760713 RepID=A0A7G5XHR9_9BACT|nr:MerR family transcriptional regulator [Lacibacter sediminis]QNA45022.1 MerR family transcriptional regulator [Lacibacter sediminis]